MRRKDREDKSTSSDIHQPCSDFVHKSTNLKVYMYYKHVYLPSYTAMKKTTYKEKM